MDNNNWNNWDNLDEQAAPSEQLEQVVEPVADAAYAEPTVDAFFAESAAEAAFAEPAVDAPMQWVEPIQQAVYHPDIPSRDYDGNNRYTDFDGSTGSSKPKGYVTKKLLAIALILTMLATSGFTILGLALAGVFDKNISAHNNNIITPTNYTISESTKAQFSIQEIAAINENAVVEIQTESLVTDFWIQNYVTQGAGSGVIIDSEGYILTCYHVIENARSITVTTKNGAHYDATVVGYDELTDLAVLKIKGSNFTTVTYGDSSSLSIGDLAVVIGNPLGQLGGSISAGIVSALDRSVVVEGKAMTLIQTDASINPGNSGGGLFDGSGRLIGIVVAKAGDSSSKVEGIGFAIPISQASVIADQIIEHGKVPRPLIGVMIVDVTSETAAMQFGVNEIGLFIDEVTGENAKAAGLQKGDIIKAVNDTAIRNRYDLMVELSKHKAGDKVTVIVSRDGEMVEIETVLQEGE